MQNTLEKYSKKNIKIISNLKQVEVFLFFAFIYIALFTGIIIFINFISTKTTNVQAYNNSLNVAINQNINTLLSVEEKNSSEKIISSLIYSGLLKKIENEYVYDIAEEISYDEGYKNIDIKIKPDAKFSDGSEIKSDDIIWTYELAKNPNFNSIFKISLEGVNFEKINDKVLRINLKNNYPEIKELLTVGILKSEYMKNVNTDPSKIKDFKIENIYSGVYKINETIKEDNKETFVLKENKYYHSKPYIKYIDFYSYKIQEDIIKDYNKNLIDLVLNYNNADIINEDIKDDSKIISYTLPINNSLFLNSNKIQEFAKAENRKAIYEAINRIEILNKIPSLQATTTYDIMPASKNTVLIEKELSSLKSENNIVNDSTNKNKEINFYIVQTENNKILAEEIKKSIENLSFLQNYNINIISKNPIEINNDIIKNRDFDMLIYGIEINNPSSLYLFLHSSQLSFPGLNITSIANNKRDSILQKIKNSKNQEEQIEFLKELKENYYTDYPFIPLYSNNKNVLFRNNLNIQIPENIKDEEEILSNIINANTKYQKVWPILYNAKLEYLINKYLH